MELRLPRSSDYGIYDVALDGKPELKGVDLYNPIVRPNSVRIGARRLEAGRHTITLKNVGANPASKIDRSNQPGYCIGLDALLLSEMK